jgi:hypothetical protein
MGIIDSSTEIGGIFIGGVNVPSNKKSINTKSSWLVCQLRIIGKFCEISSTFRDSYKLHKYQQIIPSRNAFNLVPVSSQLTDEGQTDI